MQDNILTEQKVDWLLDQLQGWKNKQLAYYSTPSIHTEYNPPRYSVADREQKLLQTSSDLLD